MSAKKAMAAAGGVACLVLAGCSSTASEPDATESSRSDATENAASAAPTVGVGDTPFTQIHKAICWNDSFVTQSVAIKIPDKATAFKTRLNGADGWGR